MDKEQMLQKYKAIGFNKAQMFEIEIAIENGLTEDEINIFAKLDFNDSQMRQIRYTLENNLTAETKLTKDQIKFIANPDLEWYEMSLIKTCYKYNMLQNEMEELLAQCKSLGVNKTNGIIRGVESNLSLDEIKFYINSELNSSKMVEIRQILKWNATLEHKYSLEELRFVINPKLNKKQIEEIRLGLEHGLLISEVKIYAKPEYHEYQMEEIRLALEHKLTQDQINFITNPDLESYEMRLIRVCCENNVAQNEIEELISLKFNEMQTYEIIYGLKNGLTIDEIKTYAIPELSWLDMKNARKQTEAEHEQNKQFEEATNPKPKLIEQNEINDNQDLDKIIADNPTDITDGQNNDLNKNNKKLDSYEQGL